MRERRKLETFARTATGAYCLFSGKVNTTNTDRKEVGLWLPSGATFKLTGVLALEAEALGLNETTGAAVRFVVRAVYRRTAGGPTGALECAAYSAQVEPGTSDWNAAIELVGTSVAVALYGGSDPVTWLVNFSASLAQKET